MKSFCLLMFACCFYTVSKGQIPEPIVPVIKEPGVVWAEPDITEPRYPGGGAAFYKYFDDNFVYQNEELRQIQGKVFMSFIIEKDGSLTNFKAMRSPSAELTKECIRIM